MVTMYDNDSPYPGSFDPGQGWWSYAPNHIEVVQGEPIVFQNPASNFQRHTVTSLERVGGSFDNTMVPGTKFDSTPNAASVIAIGSSWTLDTSTLTPANYYYYCRFHPWMLGSFSVTAP